MTAMKRDPDLPKGMSMHPRGSGKLAVVFAIGTKNRQQRWVTLKADSRDEAIRELAPIIDRWKRLPRSNQRAQGLLLLEMFGKWDGMVAIFKKEGTGRFKIGEGPCAICGNVRKLCRDHCHTTGYQRDKICRTCNVMLGMAHDDVTVLRAGADYLERFKREHYDRDDFALERDIRTGDDRAVAASDDALGVR